MDQSEHDGPSAKSLRAIAGALDLPVEAFLQLAPSDTSAPSADEAAELLALFHQIADPQHRRRCLALVRSLVDLAGVRLPALR